jgi:outer membrane beta-barrel protein
MESRILVFLLAALAAAATSGCSRGLERPASAEQPPVIEPELDRREIDPPRIGASNFEVGLFVGQLSVEDFGVNTVVGARLAYHVTEGLFVELAAGRTDTEETSFERLSGAAQLLTESERQFTYYNVSIGYNVLPGEVFIGRRRAMSSALYVIGGVGKTKFAGDDRFTVNLGVGARVLPFDWLAVHADIRNHMFDIDLLGRAKRAHNLEAHIGVTFFF